MKLSYAITVCNESKDLYSLISFLKRVKDEEDEINVLVDTKHVTPQVLRVLDHFKDDIVTCERSFDGDFSAHRNFHTRQCSGDYIFIIDPDEMPKEKLIKGIKGVINETNVDLIKVPRINICLGATDTWYKDHGFTVNECDWVNWPDYIDRVYKNKPSEIKYGNSLHESITGYDKFISISPHPQMAILHVKTVEKDNNRWTDGKLKLREDENLYDSLM
jgi:hypothetical protein